MTDNQLSCKSILKRKSLEISFSVEESLAPVIKPEDPPQPSQCSSNNINLKSYSRQGILKKHSASFDDESTQKPILKNRCQSCDDDTMLNLNELHSILKRKTSEPCEHSEPHGILKKREFAVAHPQSSDHNRLMYATTATAITASLDDDVRPCLKQKKSSECDSPDESGHPKPILKKKSTESLDGKRPILKSSRNGSPANRASSKRLSVAQRVSNLESIMHDSDIYCKKPSKENSRSSRDRSRFHTQPVTPSEIEAIKKKYVACINYSCIMLYTFSR